MQKVKIDRRYSDGVIQQFGADSPILKELVQRSLQVARTSSRNYLVSGYIGQSVFVVTNIYKDGVKQFVCLAAELPQKHRQTVKSGPLVNAGVHAFVLDGKM